MATASQSTCTRAGVQTERCRTTTEDGAGAHGRCGPRSWDVGSPVAPVTVPSTEGRRSLGETSWRSAWGRWSWSETGG